MKPTRILRLLSLPIALIAVAAYLWFRRESLARTHLEHPWMLLEVVVGIAANLAAASSMNRLMARQLGAPISHTESFALVSVASLANALLPIRGGAGIRAAYLKRVYGLSLTAFASSLFGFQVLATLAATATAGLALVWLAVTGTHGVGIVATGVAVGLAVAAATLAVPTVRPGVTRFGRALSEFTHGWHSIKHDPAVLLKLAVLATCQIAASLVVFWASMRSLGSNQGTVAIVVTGSLGVVASLFALTPGSLGIYEAAVGIIGTVLGGDTVRLVSAALLQRLSAVAIAAILTGATWHLLQEKRQPYEAGG